MEALAVKAALGVGSSVLVSALKLAGSAAVKEVARILKLETEIENIKSELRMMQAFLKRAAAKEIQDPLVENIVKEVKDLSYEAEDCIAEFAVHVNAKRMLRINFMAQSRIAKSIERLKEKLEICTKSFKNFKGIIPDQLNYDGSNIADNCLEPRLTEPLYVDESDLVGLDTSKQELMELILSDQETSVHVKEVVVSGMGGIGKTTLVKKIYDSPNLSSKFDCFCWLTISTSFNIGSLVADMAKQLCGKEKAKEFEKMNTREISDDLHNYLKEKKCLVILDDLWEVADWKKIKPFLPPRRTVMVTSRDETVVAGAVIYRVKELNDSDSLNLLMKKVLRKYASEEIPAELTEIALKFLKSCKGLPLALATIGGFLASFPLDKDKWNELFEYFRTELDRNPEIEPMRKVLVLSYLHLPENLKSCFLYLMIFPEDYEIKRSDLVKHWIAQDYVLTEEDAESNFNNLLNRNMIIPSKFDIVYGGVKTCRIHDILREVMISIAAKENFLLSLNKRTRISSYEKVRHVALSGNASIDDLCSTNLNCIRSISTFGYYAYLGDWSTSCSFTMLKVLDAQFPSSYFERKEIITVKGFEGTTELRHLKYINVGNHVGLGRLPRKISKIRGLRILDVSNTEIRELTSDLSKLLDMRHIYTGGKARGANVNRGILGNLKELRTLKYLYLRCDCASNVLKEIAELSQLRVFGICHIDEQRDGKLLCWTIENLKKLVNFSLSLGYNSSACIILDSILWPPLLRSLSLSYISSKSLSWVASLKNLRKLSLAFTYLKSDVIVMLGGLPELVILKLLDNALESCEELAFGIGSFAKLMRLEVSMGPPRRSVVISEGALRACKSMEFSRSFIVSITGAHNLRSLEDLTINEDVMSSPGKFSGEEELRRIMQELPKKPRFKREEYLYANAVSHFTTIRDDGS